MAGEGIVNQRYETGDLKYVKVDAGDDGVNAVVAPVAGRKIQVLAYVLSTSAAQVITLQDSGATPKVHAKIRCGNPTPFAYNGPVPAFETTISLGLDVSNTAGSDTFGHIVYREV